jgi:hypothetical protein
LTASAARSTDFFLARFPDPGSCVATGLLFLRPYSCHFTVIFTPFPMPVWDLYVRF